MMAANAPRPVAHRALAEYRSAVEAACLSADRLMTDVQRATTAAATLEQYLDEEGRAMLATRWAPALPPAQWAADVPAIIARVKAAL